MSAIDELRNGVVIDTTDYKDDDGQAATDSVGITIDTTNESNNMVDLSSLAKNKNNHQVVMPRSNNNIAHNVRQAINIDSVAVPEPEDEDIHEKPEKDILNLDDPNSIFSKYVAEKEEEAKEWIAEKEEERQILESEIENDEEDSYDYSDNSSSGSLVNEVFESNTDTSNLKYNADDELDLSDLVDDDKEDTDDEDNSVSEDTNENKEEIKAAEEVVTSYDAPDIDVEISDDGTEKFTAEIVEDDESEIMKENEDQEDFLKHLQKLATEKLKPVSKQLDISSFTVLKKPVSNITPLFKESNARVAKWVLPAQESIVLMKEFSGSELEKLREYSESSRSVDALNRRFHMIYDHIVSPKPASFETWLKTTPAQDVDNYFFAIYIASFKGANYLPEDCINPSCKETFLTDDVNIMDMVKFDTKEAKNKFVDLYQSEATPAGKGVYCTEVVPMNEKIAIAFRQPSIYNIFEIASLDEKTKTQYSSILDYIPYIDTVYSIDMVSKTLTPIGYKMFSDNAQRTVKSKIQKYNNIFSTFSVDEFGPVKAYVAAIAEKTTGMRYVYPAVECPKCHTLTREQNATAEELVFTRYQLGSLVNISLS